MSTPLRQAALALLEPSGGIDTLHKRQALREALKAEGQLYAARITLGHADEAETVALFEAPSHAEATEKAEKWFKTSGWPEQGCQLHGVEHVDLGRLRREGVLEI